MNKLLSIILILCLQYAASTFLTVSKTNVSDLSKCPCTCPKPAWGGRTEWIGGGHFIKDDTKCRIPGYHKKCKQHKYEKHQSGREIKVCAKWVTLDEVCMAFQKDADACPKFLEELEKKKKEQEAKDAEAAKKRLEEEKKKTNYIPKQAYRGPPPKKTTNKNKNKNKNKKNDPDQN